MKHLMTLLALVVAVTAGAQTFIHEYPWNPDWDNDNFVGSSDLTGFLSAFGSEFGNPPEPCDYDGTSGEQLIIGILDETIILDSVFVEFEVETVYSYYFQGCPELIIDTIVVAGAGMMQDAVVNSNEVMGIYGGGFTWYLFYSDDGNYSGYIENGQISEAVSGYDSNPFDGERGWLVESPLPIADIYQLDENGLTLNFQEYNWPSYANYIHILPYWHYAE